MGNQIRLCVVSPLFHPNLGGVGRQAVALTEHLYKSDVKLFVICRNIKGLTAWKTAPDLSVIKICALSPRRHDLEEKTLINLLISLSFCFSLLVTLIRNRKEFDIAHFHGASLPLIFNVLPLKLMRKKIIAKVAGAKMDIEAGSFKGKYLLLGNIFIKILKRVDAFIAISSEIKGDLIKDGFDEQRISEISNFIREEDFYPVKDREGIKSLKDKLGVGSEKKIITFSGRLVQRKRVDVLLNAVAEVLKVRKDVQVIILGQGEVEGTLKSMASELGIQGHVSFKSFVSNILDYLQITDIFVFPSEKEGMPNSLLEAMACRLPVISTRVGGVMDVVKDRENGLVVKPGNADELKDAILTLLEDRHLSESIAESAYQTIREGYYIDKVVDRYVSLYRKVLNAVRIF